MATFVIEAMVRGYHVYQSVWSPTAGEQLPCRKEPSNIQDPFSVAGCKGEKLLSLLLQSKKTVLFLDRGPLGSGRFTVASLSALKYKLATDHDRHVAEGRGRPLNN